MNSPKKKQNKALWVSCFKDQAKALRPENSKAGGVRARSQPETVRMGIYNAIRVLYQTVHPWCELCEIIWGDTSMHEADDNHHCRSREGLLLFDPRYFKSACRRSHDWVKDHPEEAKKLGIWNPPV